MSVNAVDTYFKAQLNAGGGLAVLDAVVEAHTSPLPTTVTLPNNKLYVYLLAERVVTDHPEYSGPLGFRRKHYAPYAFTIWKTLLPTEAALDGFKPYVRGLTSFLTTLGGNIPIVDPVTSVGSYLTHIGESFQEQYWMPPFISTMRSVIARCKVGFDLYERTFGHDG